MGVGGWCGGRSVRNVYISVAFTAGDCVSDWSMVIE